MSKAVKMSSLLPQAFHPMWKATFNRDILHIIGKGGRGSGKSSTVSHIIVQLIMRYPANAVAIRKYDNTLELSVYEQIKWAVFEQGVGHLFKFSKSPMRITYLPRGNYIAFRGALEPERIKSLKDSRFPFAIAWIEEEAEFKTEAEVTTITNSILRGELGNGLFYKFFHTYNPPKRKHAWVNKKYESVLQPKNTFVHHSTYLDNPFISRDFIQEAENAKEMNELRYKWEYLGHAIGSGVAPFENLVFREIPDDELARFDSIRQGNDFGYANDPNAFTRWHYDKKRRKIYAIGEIYGVKMSNRQLAEYIKAKGYHHHAITCDSAEPKSIDELRFEHNLPRVKGAKKGPDSVEYGERWLDDLDEIVIDPERTPNIAREFESIDYEVDRDGNPKTKLEETDNHCIDSARYAFEDDMKQPGISFW